MTTNRWLTLLASASLSASGLIGCSVDDGSSDPEDSVSDDSALSSECDRSAFNCKLPAAPSDRNRIYDNAAKSYDWPLKSGQRPEMVDGNGVPRGKVATGSVKINYGGRKKINGKTYVYAFAVPLDTKVTASDWIPESTVRDSLSRMATVEGKNPGHGDYQATWTVTGGDVSAFAGLKVSKDYSGDDRNATDYLLRTGGVMNLLYNLPGEGGVSTDTFVAGAKFKRSKSVDALDVDLYHKGKGTVVRRMSFVYGHIGSRYGWIARDALKEDVAASPNPAPSCASAGPQECYAKCANREDYHLVEGVTSGCTEKAEDYCSVNDRGSFQDAMWSKCDPS